jgi:hypothetical protein
MSKSTEGNIRLNLPQLLLIWADMAKRFSNCDVASKQYPRDKDDPKYKKNPYFTVDRRKVNFLISFKSIEGEN